MAINKKDMLLTFYEHVLLALGCVVTSDGMVSLESTGEPITLNTGERLVLPTDERLAKLGSSQTVAFHPMAENVILGQSSVIRLTRMLVNQSITHKVITSMLGIAQAISTGAEMKSTQISKLSTVSGIDAKTVKSLSKLMQVIDHQSPQRLVNVFLKHGGSIGDNSYKRTAYVSWPLYEELVSVSNDNGDTVYGVAMRKKDVILIRQLFELMIEHAGEPDYYSAGSNSKAAPYFHALLSAFGKVLEDLNTMTWMFRKVIYDTVSENPHVTTTFIEDFGEGDAYRNIIPGLDHNQGSSVDGQTSDNTQQVQQQQQQQAQPVQQQVQHPQQQGTPMYQPPQQPAPVYHNYNAPVPVPAPAQPQSRWNNIPTIGAQSGPATGISKDGQAVTQNAQTNVLQTQQDIMNVAYPATMYPHLYPQNMQNMQMMPAPQYPTFGNANGQQPVMMAAPNQMAAPQYQQQFQPQYQQQFQPQYQQQFQPQYMMAPNQMMQPQPQSSGGYPSFTRAT